MTRRVGRRRLGHLNWRRGFFANSRSGSDYFARQGKNWTDKDGHLSAPDRETGQCAWVIAHGAPETFWLPKGHRFEEYPADRLFALRRAHGAQTYQLSNLRQAFADNHRRGLGTELDVKHLTPCDTPEILDDAFARFARHARDVYGPDWRRHVNAKVLTTWGLAYALRICKAAHAHGIPTLLSVRGRHRRTFKGHPAVTYVRGSLRTNRSLR